MTAPWKRVETEEEIDNLYVTLPNILGVPPKKYVPVLFGVVLVLALFLVLVLPGIRNYGSVVTVTSAPSGASVYVDERRLGSTPVETFLSAGSHTIRLEFPGLVAERVDIDVPGRRIGSAIVPSRVSVEHPFSHGVDTAAVDDLVVDYHRWALSGDAGPQFQHPPLARIIGRALWAIPSDAEPTTTVTRYPDGMWGETVSSILSATTSTQIPDAVGGVLHRQSAGGTFLPSDIGEIVRIFIHLDNSSPLFAAAAADVVADLSGTLPMLESDTVAAWISDRREALSTSLLAASVGLDERGIPNATKRVIGGLTFAMVPPGEYILGYPAREFDGNALPVRFERSFYLLDHEVRKRDFARFVADETQWSPENREEQVKNGLVESTYLQDWPADWRERFVSGADAQAEEPVRYVSWYAAEAFARWFSVTNRDVIETLPQPAAEGSGDVSSTEDAALTPVVGLPSPAMWEYAAFLNALGPADQVFDAAEPQDSRSGTAGALGIWHLQGNLWEWTNEWYTANRRFIAATTGAQRTVIGGSYVNQRTPPGTAGGQPPAWCTPFLGFRIAIYDPAMGAIDE